VPTANLAPSTFQQLVSVGRVYQMVRNAIASGVEA
jgi:hypothetical protein